jgi:PIN domain nuclease of toxin-antitoxin system
LSFLLDTHALIWWAQADDRLPKRAREVIADPDNAISLSAASAWEVAVKFKLGKLPAADRLVSNLQNGEGLEDFDDLPISRAHALLAATMDIPHKDPFDRMLIAQAQAERLTLISNERLFDSFGVKRLWD